MDGDGNLGINSARMKETENTSALYDNKCGPHTTILHILPSFIYLGVIKIQIGGLKKRKKKLIHSIQALYIHGWDV